MACFQKPNNWSHGWSSAVVAGHFWEAEVVLLIDNLSLLKIRTTEYNFQSWAMIIWGDHDGFVISICISISTFPSPKHTPQENRGTESNWWLFSKQSGLKETPLTKQKERMKSNADEGPGEELDQSGRESSISWTLKDTTKRENDGVSVERSAYLRLDAVHAFLARDYFDGRSFRYWLSIRSLITSLQWKTFYSSDMLACLSEWRQRKWKVSCPEGKSPCPGQSDDTFFEPCIS